MYEPPSNEGSLLRLQALHAEKHLSVLTRSQMLFMTLKAGLNQPTEPVWGNRYQYAPVIVEIQKKSTAKIKMLPNWNFFMGFGQQFLLNALQTEDGIHYFCVGFALSPTCLRERHAIAFLSLAPGAKEKLTALHKDPQKVQKLMADVQRTPSAISSEYTYPRNNRSTGGGNYFGRT